MVRHARDKRVDTKGRPPIVFGPAGACDCCARFAISLDQVGSVTEPGIRCFHCGNGRFRHRSLWRYSYCPAPGCNGVGCEGCHWTGIVATPADV